MRLPLAALLLLVAGDPLQGAAPVNLAVTVEEVANGSGHLLVAVCTPETFLRADCPYTSRAPAVAGEALVVVRGIEPGVYAVQAFHDENDTSIGTSLAAAGRHGLQQRCADALRAADL
jgi:uncharacterized protein (DUF2141 family)